MFFCRPYVVWLVFLVNHQLEKSLCCPSSYPQSRYRKCLGPPCYLLICWKHLPYTRAQMCRESWCARRAISYEMLGGCIFFKLPDFLTKQSAVGSVNNIAIKAYVYFSYPIDPPRGPATVTSESLSMRRQYPHSFYYSELPLKYTWSSYDAGSLHPWGRRTKGRCEMWALGKMTLVILRQNQGLTGNKAWWSWGPAITRNCLSWESRQ